jgi:hypothetical protein
MGFVSLAISGLPMEFCGGSIALYKHTIWYRVTVYEPRVRIDNPRLGEYKLLLELYHGYEDIQYVMCERWLGSRIVGGAVRFGGTRRHWSHLPSSQALSRTRVSTASMQYSMYQSVSSGIHAMPLNYQQTLQICPPHPIYTPFFRSPASVASPPSESESVSAPTMPKGFYRFDIDEIISL